MGLYRDYCPLGKGCHQSIAALRKDGARISLLVLAKWGLSCSDLDLGKLYVVCMSRVFTGQSWGVR
jgi:hypothetical protein